MNLETAIKGLPLIAFNATLECGLQQKVVSYATLLELLNKVSEPTHKTPQEYLKLYSEDEMRPIDLITLIINDCKK